MRLTDFIKSLFCSCEQGEIIRLKNQIEVMESALLPNEKEEYYNNKYPKTDIKYKGRSIPNVGMVQIDVRDFFTIYNSDIVNRVKNNNLNVGNDDEKALRCLTWVIEHFKYVPDKSVFGVDEYWEFPYEATLLMKGDCDDGAIFLANLMQVSGIPYWKIRLVAGSVNGGGHCWVTYYCEELDHWVVLDWCYWPSKLPIKNRPDYKDELNYWEPWFSWNQKYAFSKDTRDDTKFDIV